MNLLCKNNLFVEYIHLTRMIVLKRGGIKIEVKQISQRSGSKNR